MKNQDFEPITEAESPTLEAKITDRSEALAARLEAGAAALVAFATSLSEIEWEMRSQKDGRKVGVVVHHVASMYPVEIHLASLLAAGKPIADLTWEAVDAINRDHARDNDGVTKEAALALLAANSAVRPQRSVLLPMKNWTARRPCLEQRCSAHLSVHA